MKETDFFWISYWSILLIRNILGDNGSMDLGYNWNGHRPHLGPCLFWSLRNLVPEKFGPQEIWAPRSLGPKKFWPCMKIII
jgi:hypothetical protein